LSPRGVACFDCESLIAASRLAFHQGRPFPCPEAIISSRNKYECRKIWSNAGVISPRATVVSNLNETLKFFRQVKKDIVLKPICGSGSELLFYCKDEATIEESVSVMKEQLPRRIGNPLFRPISHPSLRNGYIDPCRLWLAEEFVDGPEFSCDFVLHNDQVVIVRETGKIKAPGMTFGSILAYVIPPSYPVGFKKDNLHMALKKCAKSLGFNRGHFMADFIIKDGDTFIIEISARPGGDSIPDLLITATGFDLIGYHLDLVSEISRPSFKLDYESPESFASINLFAKQTGLITHLDPSQILAKHWVKKLFMKKNVGDNTRLPPDDYDNRLLGYCIISNESGCDPISTSKHLHELLKISIER
ncbi:MAG: acetyl-CoA carboxylase biotin carboxylase subunit family protein, partial [Candidatus Heimdallarchaeota archaeon]